jgi:hypothetical protein
LQKQKELLEAVTATGATCPSHNSHDPTSSLFNDLKITGSVSNNKLTTFAAGAMPKSCVHHMISAFTKNPGFRKTDGILLKTSPEGK